MSLFFFFLLSPPSQSTQHWSLREQNKASLTFGFSHCDHFSILMSHFYKTGVFSFSSVSRFVILLHGVFKVSFIASRKGKATRKEDKQCKIHNKIMLAKSNIIRSNNYKVFFRRPQGHLVYIFCTCNLGLNAFLCRGLHGTKPANHFSLI